MTGLSRLKKQYGRYAAVAIPRTPAMYAPQLFHGISGDVTVPASSTVLDSMRGAIRRFANSIRYTRLGITIETYWSPERMFSPMQVPMTEAIRAPVLFACAMTGRTSRSRKPAYSMTAAKLNAPRISQIVKSIEDMPPRLKRLSIVSFPEFDTNPFAIAA